LPHSREMLPHWLGTKKAKMTVDSLR
jgi:hypothetical protein